MRKRGRNRQTDRGKKRDTVDRRAPLYSWGRWNLRRFFTFFVNITYKHLQVLKTANPQHKPSPNTCLTYRYRHIDIMTSYPQSHHLLPAAGLPGGCGSSARSHAQAVESEWSILWTPSYTIWNQAVASDFGIQKVIEIQHISDDLLSTWTSSPRKLEDKGYTGAGWGCQVWSQMRGLYRWIMTSA